MIRTLLATALIAGLAASAAATGSAKTTRNSVAPSPTGWHFASPIRLPVADGGQSLALADYTGDGRADLITTRRIVQSSVTTTMVQLFTQTPEGGLETTWKGIYPSYPEATVLPVRTPRSTTPALAVLTSNGIHILANWTKSGPASSISGERTNPTAASWIPSPSGSTGALLTGANTPLRLHHEWADSLQSKPFPLTVSGFDQGATADLDGDGDYDFAFTGWLRPGVWSAQLLRNISTRSGWAFEAMEEITFSCDSSYGPNGRGIAIADFNDDGHVDIAISQSRNRPYSCIGVAYGDGTGAYSTPVIYPSTDLPQVLTAVDINTDGRTDLLSFHGGWGRVGVYLQAQDGTLAPPIYVTVPYVSHYYSEGVVAGDFIGDRCPDVAIGYSAAAPVVLEGRGCFNTPIE